MSSENPPDPKKRMTGAITVFKRLSGASASIRSRGSSMLSKYQREMMGFQECDTLRCREWLFALVECMLAFSWQSISAREKSEETMKIRGMTPREDTINTLFWIGLTSFANITVGQLMDSLTGYYMMAFVNIILHFTVSSFFLLSEIVHETSSEDVYAHLLSNVYKVVFIPIKALGFTRYVYAMDQVGTGKGSAFIIHYTFIFNLFNLTGNALFAVVKDAGPSKGLLSAIVFCVNGTVLFLYSYIFRPRPPLTIPPPHDAAIKIWGVLITALRNKWKFRGKIKRQEWLDYAENKYDKAQIARSMQIFRLLLMITPTTGFLLFTTYQNIIYKEFYDGLKFSGPNVPKLVKWIIPISSLMIAVFVEYVFLPVLRACKYKINFLRRFLIGYMSMLLAVLMAAMITTKTEKLPIRPNSGTFRIFNTMEGRVSFSSMQNQVTQLQFSVQHHEFFLTNFEVSEENLFRMAVTFVNSSAGDDTANGNVTTYTQLVSASPEQVLQYVTLAPSSIIRVPGPLPVKEGPPGQNDAGKPRCFVVSLIADQTQSIYVINDKTEKRNTFNVGPGQVIVFQVEEGNYTLKYTSSISQTTNSMLESGGLYGIYLFLGINKYEIDVDKIVPENTKSAWIALTVSAPMTLAKVFGQVSLDAFVYASAPDGLKGLAYGFYILCIHLAAWFLLFGFHTWHHYVTPNIILVYALLALIFFFFCLLLLVRYKDHYAM